jgi:hypothetical protein
MSTDAEEPVKKLQKELYVPRKCAATNKVIGASDHAAVQINGTSLVNVLLFRIYDDANGNPPLVGVVSPCSSRFVVRSTPSH